MGSTKVQQAPAVPALVESDLAILNCLLTMHVTTHMMLADKEYIVGRYGIHNGAEQSQNHRMV